jgi:hypothetical protein
MVLVFALMTLFQVNSTASFPPIGIIDYYGIRSVSPDLIRQKLGIHIGDTPSTEQMSDAKHRLEAIPGVAEAYFDHPCCEQGREMLYVGIREKSATTFQYRSAPYGTIVLPGEVLNWAREFEQALGEAVLSGEGEDDHSQGHSLIKYPKARAIQDKYIVFAAQNEDLLRKVLRTSANSEQRAIAASVIAYASDKRKIVGDLVYAVFDPDENVRNNAARALGIIASFAAREPSKRIKVPSDPFIHMLNSYVWTDRNKASFALFQLTESRNPKLLSKLRKKALASLIEMARWQSPGHAMFSFVVLSRIAGIPEKDIFGDFNNDREKVIAAATNSVQ